MTLTAALLLGVALVLSITVTAAVLAHARRRQILDRSAGRARRGDRHHHRPPRPRQGDPPA